ncbi:unnamed protein product [Heligmosomoides polygyrus]|uniref:Fe2OG dioxygenase domain-containing protein n=1 Tax=Heligmosomoides polygyrus TaxID=6339 RepID=A0A3P7YVK3_HELPZ|nr:unnamed protein product [Heligmosomoides polygyrus]
MGADSKAQKVLLAVNTPPNEALFCYTNVYNYQRLNVEVLSEDPVLIVFRKFASDEEVAGVLEDVKKEELHAAKVVDQDAEGVAAMEGPGRRTNVTFVAHEKTARIALIFRRAKAMIPFVKFENSEIWQVVAEKKVPESWQQNTTIPIWKKKGSPAYCASYRPIRLFSHTVKIFERIVDGRIRDVVQFPTNQCGFAFGCNTVDAIHAVRVLLEKHREKQEPVYFAFVDLEKAFDRVPRDVIWYALRENKLSGCAFCTLAQGVVCERQRALRRNFPSLQSLELHKKGTFQILSYHPGGHYAPHWDYLFFKSEEQKDVLSKEMGNRFATFLFSLQSASKGGGTVFPEVGITVMPTPGDAVFFTNMHPDESLILSYHPGGHYAPHWDYLFFKSEEQKDVLSKEMGNRFATFLFSLQSASKGGGTVFPEVGITVMPTPGDAVFFTNMHPDESLDKNSLHGACVVREGVKIAMVLWIRSKDQDLLRSPLRSGRFDINKLIRPNLYFLGKTPIYE